MSDQERLDALQGVWPSEEAHVAILQYEIIRLREGLKKLYREHHDDEFECPNHVGECVCGLVTQNSTIDFYLDPSVSRYEYLARRTREAVMTRLSDLYQQYDDAEKVHEGNDSLIEWYKEDAEIMLNVLLDAQPWLVEGAEADE